MASHKIFLLVGSSHSFSSEKSVCFCWNEWNRTKYILLVTFLNDEYFKCEFSFFLLLHNAHQLLQPYVVEQSKNH